MGRNRWRKWLILAAGVVIGIPIVAVIVLNIVFSVNAVRPDQMQPPRELLKATRQGAAGTDRATSSTLSADSINRAGAGCLTCLWQIPKNTADFEQVLTASPNKAYADLYKKLIAMKIHDEWQKAGFDKWRGGPLNEQQAKWLVEHRALIDDILKLAKAGGSPIMTVEQIMALDPFEAIRCPVPNFLEIQTFGRILSAEAVRRFAAGDQAGAAEAILAISPIAKATSEPFLISHLIGVSMQQLAAREVSRWLESGNVSASMARSLSGQLATPQIDLNNYRRTMECEYYNMRRLMTSMMAGSFSRIVQMNMQGNVDESFLPYLYRHLTTDPILAGKQLASGTAMGIALKATASQTLENYDSNYQKMFGAMDRGDIVDPNSFTHGYWFDPTPNFTEAQSRTNVSIAMQELDVAGLEMIAGKPAVEQQDPFIEQPLKTVEESGSTLIYSVGPDRQDQRGGITYDPTNGTLSAGDIWVRVKKK